MSKEIEETRRIKAEAKQQEVEISKYMEKIYKDMEAKGWMFAVVIGDKYGRCMQTSALGPTQAWPRISSAIMESLTRFQSDRIAKLERLIKDNEIYLPEEENYDAGLN